MVTQITHSNTQQDTQHKPNSVLATYHAMQNWTHWEEVYLNCVKESPLTYVAFAQAVQAGDSSPEAFDRALVTSQMTREQFDVYLPEFQKFMALYKEYSPLSMLSDGVDQIWHGFMLVSDRYREFCIELVGCIVDHLPCSLYEMHGVQVPRGSCVGKCVPKTCSGNGGGCGSEKHRTNRDTDLEATKQGILGGVEVFRHAYLEVFGSPPAVELWNQLATI
jgi:hypothetical protein